MMVVKCISVRRNLYDDKQEEKMNEIVFDFGYIMVLHGYAYLTYRVNSRVYTCQMGSLEG